VTGFWSGRRVLLTGAGGFIGFHVASLLTARGACLTATTSPRADPQRVLRLRALGCAQVTPIAHR